MGGVSRTLTSWYDAHSSRYQLGWPDGHYVSTVRDGLDRTYYTEVDGTVPLFHTPFDAQGRPAAVYRWVGGTWGAHTGYGYDGIGRLAWFGQGIAGATVTTTFGYNPASQLVGQTRDNDAYRFTGHANANRGYTANGLNQHTSAGSASFTHDANGNLTSDGTNTFTYDVENRLVAASGGVELAYDPLGRLMQTWINGANVKQFLYDGDALVAEYDASGNMTNRYVHGDGVDQPLVWYQGSATTSPRYLYADQQGSIVATADASGNLIGAPNAYDEYGVPAAGNSGRFQYTGQAWLPELGMYYYKARIYAPALGRFMQTDPIGYEGGTNLYNYVGSDPVNGSYPSGLACYFVSRITGCGTGSGGKQAESGSGGSGGGGFGSGGGGGGPGEVLVTAAKRPVYVSDTLAQLGAAERSGNVSFGAIAEGKLQGVKSRG